MYQFLLKPVTKTDVAIVVVIAIVILTLSGCN